MRYLLQHLLSRNFLSLLRYSSLIFSFISSCLMVSASKYLLFSFSPSFLTDLVVLFVPPILFSYLLLKTWHIFHCQIPFLYPHCTFIFFVFVSQVLFPLAFSNSLISSMCIRRLIFSCDFVNLKFPLHFQNIKLSGIIARIKNSGQLESPWMMILWIFTSITVSLLSSFSMAYEMKFMIFLDIWYIFRHSIIQVCRTIL